MAEFSRNPQTEEQFIHGVKGMAPPPVLDGEELLSQGRDDYTKGVHYKIPEPLWFKLEFINRHTPMSKQAWGLQVLTEAIEAEVKRIKGE